MYWKAVLAVLVIVASAPVSAQVLAPATKDGASLGIGAGYSNFYSDYNGRLGGPSVWLDWCNCRGPSPLSGLGVELIFRDLNYDKTGTVSNLREVTAGGGPMYVWRHTRRFHPYVKFLIAYGSIDFTWLSPTYTHDTRTVYAPSGGLDYRLHGRVFLRGDYEYQIWPHIFTGNALTPHGFTIGASYKFRSAER